MALDAVNRTIFKEDASQHCRKDWGKWVGTRRKRKEGAAPTPRKDLLTSRTIDNGSHSRLRLLVRGLDDVLAKTALSYSPQILQWV